MSVSPPWRDAIFDSPVPRIERSCRVSPEKLTALNPLSRTQIEIESSATVERLPEKIWQHLTPLSRTQIEIESGADVERLPENLAALNPSVTHADRDRIERR